MPRALPLLIPAVAVLIAAAQVTGATRAHLSPWKGGGFGMFASRASPGQRYVRITAVDAAGAAYLVYLPSGRFGNTSGLSTRDFVRASTLGRAADLDRIAQAVLAAGFAATRQRPFELPARVATDPRYRALADLGDSGVLLEVVAARRDPDRHTGVVGVEVSLSSFSFDGRTGRLRLESFGPVGRAGITVHLARQK